MYNFDELAQRRNTSSYKWDVLENELPMWVADMDFMVAKPIKDSILKRTEIMAYGYSNVPNEFYTAYKNFFKDIHNLELKEEWMIFSTGVVPSISSIVRSTTALGDNVVVLSPVYNIFYNSIINNHRNPSPCNLTYKDGKYSIDFSLLEKIMSDPKTTLMIFCNPHNPTGNIWTKEELENVLILAKKYDVLVISDEIHADIMAPGRKYNSMFSIEGYDKNVLLLLSASKCFNIAGLQASIAVVKDKDLRYKVWRGINTDECGENNFFCAQAHISALNDSRDWLSLMNDYVYKNKKIAYNFIKNNINELKVIESDALYLIWVDISSLKIDSDEFVSKLREYNGLYISSGNIFGENGKGFVRINLATSLKNVVDGMNRLESFVKYLKNRCKNDF